jgi:nicotinate-nucleotide adenylyltransferase
MVEAVVEKEPSFAVSRIEIEREGPSYTIDTLAELQKSLPGTELFFITGIDSFRDIQTWNRWEELLESYAFIVHARPGSGLTMAYESVPEGMRSMLIELSDDPARPAGRGGTVYLIRAVTLDVSSTEIRAMVRAGRSIRFLVPAAVEAYIQKNRLYREGV